ncbi:MAG: ABC transporter permease subunit [Chloroflexi bacterium]|nr:ABC transporter permease subunit [Chloroflexota bacterium]
MANTHHERRPQWSDRITNYLSHLINPIIIKEMRAQMRGPRAFRTLTYYLIGLALLAFGLYRVTVAGAQDRFGAEVHFQSAYIGQTLFVGLALLEMAFVCFITPALTAGAISSETERRTYDMLLSTPLRPVSIVWGKMFASLTFVQLLILAAVPLASIIFVFGGVAVRDVIQTIGLLILTAITFGTVGVFFSALTRRTGPAMALSYLVVLCFVGSNLVWPIAEAVKAADPPRQILYVNPISSLATAVLTPDMVRGMHGTTPTVRLLFLMGGRPDRLGLWSNMASARPIWQYTVALYSGLTVLLYLATTRLVRPVRHSRVRPVRAVGALSFIFLLVFGLSRASLNIGNLSFGRFGNPTPSPTPFPYPVAVATQVPQPPPPMPTLTPMPMPTPTPTPLPPPPLTEMVRVNFQPITATVPSGFLKDGGEIYGDRGNGLIYGWGAPNHYTRDHNVHPDQQYDTLNHLQKQWNHNAEWEMGVPNGEYKVTLVMGDAVFPNQINGVVVEGVALEDPTPNTHDFDEYRDIIVRVHDERLTVRPGPGADNAKICFIEIAPFTKSVQNPGFEDGTFDPRQPPLHWSANVPNPISMMTWDDGHAHSGTYSVRIDSPLYNDAGWVQTMQVEPHTTYVLSGWIKTEDVQHGGGAVVAGANLDVYGTWDHTPALLGTNDWTYVEVEFDSGYNKKIEIACRLGHWGSIASGTIWCDDIDLRLK